ncbi:MAG: hydratase [Christensenellaceae bacterium]|jgi:aconitate hydratase|nr:hydratase [Christensenellaceae bacterium]
MSIKLINSKVRIDGGAVTPITKDINGYKKTLSYPILKAHSQTIAKKGAPLTIKFDAIASHDITFVGIIQTAKAIGLEKFPIPYILTNCHNSLCAVGGTINEDDHAFGLSCAKKYGAVFVPPNVAVIHTYMREQVAECGKMYLGSDSHTRYGALGAMAIGEGGPELVKQIIGHTYDVVYPDVVGIKLIGTPRKGVGPHDVALLLCANTYANGFVKNSICEFFGEGVSNISQEFRNGIDVMTTETACLSSIWVTDSLTKQYLKSFNREAAFKKLSVKDGAVYDRFIEIDLSKVEPMIALPFHPQYAYPIREVLADKEKFIKAIEERGKKIRADYSLSGAIDEKGIKIDQAIIAGCSGGTYDNIAEAARILHGSAAGEVNLSVYCGSQPLYRELSQNGVIADLVDSGAIMKPSFCGPCFGAGDVPKNGGLSIRHTTRNFENREGSKPKDGQIASVALMDARSIAATVANGGYLTSALDFDYDNTIKPVKKYDLKSYTSRVYQGYDKPNSDAKLVYGPNIADWPSQKPLADNLILKVCAAIFDPVTTTDELIPSGEASSYRSNPLKLAEFTLSRKAPDYVKLAKAVKADEDARAATNTLGDEYAAAAEIAGGIKGSVLIASTIFANSPGDGSAREQAASSQRVLGAGANIAKAYATKRYRSNLMNWGMLPYLYNGDFKFQTGDIIVLKDVLEGLKTYKQAATVVRGNEPISLLFTLDPMTADEKAIIATGCLINFEKSKIF